MNYSRQVLNKNRVHFRNSQFKNEIGIAKTAGDECYYCGENFGKGVIIYPCDGSFLVSNLILCQKCLIEICDIRVSNLDLYKGWTEENG